jgi:hypothetical protein
MNGGVAEESGVRGMRDGRGTTPIIVLLGTGGFGDSRPVIAEHPQRTCVPDWILS